jgi:hypothetical protein
MDVPVRTESCENNGAIMSHFVTCTFDLKNASRTAYENAYADLKNIGLKRTVTWEKGEVAATSTWRSVLRWPQNLRICRTVFGSASTFRA